MKVSIPNPCSEKWNTMAPSGNGRHCAVCEKTVVDFTQMSEEEIKNYFLTFSGQKTCGHFYATQLSHEPLSKGAQMVLSWYLKSKESIKYKVPRMAALFILGTTLALMGCNSHEEVEGKVLTGDSIAVSAPTVDGEIAVSSSDTLQLNDSSQKK